MKLDHLIVKKPKAQGTFILAGPEEDLIDRIEFKKLEPVEHAEVSADPGLEAVLSMPFSIVEPMSTSGSAKDSHWAWDAIGSSGNSDASAMRVAVLDSGIDRQHAAFAPRAMTLCDFTKNLKGDKDTATDDDPHGHGTHCAGILCGANVKGIRIGVVQSLEQLLIGKIFGNGAYSGTTEAIVAGLHWAISERADVISMSLGIDLFKMVQKLKSLGCSEPEANSIAFSGYRANTRLFDSIAKYIQSRDSVPGGKGVVVVAAAGNESKREQPGGSKIAPYSIRVSLPADADGFLSVGAIGRNPGTGAYFVAPFSNAGAALAAPGVEVVSAKCAIGTVNGQELVPLSGTSMATPIVAGVAALWGQRLLSKSKKPEKWADTVISRLKGTAKGADQGAQFSGLKIDDVGMGVVQAP